MLMKVLSELRASSWTALLAKQKRVSLRRLGGMRFSRDFMAVDEKMMGHLHLPLLLQPPREGGLLRRLGARSRCFCCLDPIPPTEGGGVKTNIYCLDPIPPTEGGARKPHFWRFAVG